MFFKITKLCLLFLLFIHLPANAQWNACINSDNYDLTGNYYCENSSGIETEWTYFTGYGATSKSANGAANNAAAYFNEQLGRPSLCNATWSVSGAQPWFGIIGDAFLEKNWLVILNIGLFKKQQQMNLENVQKPLI